jgi:transcriptional regulator with XRE-family HTH domain
MTLTEIGKSVRARREKKGLTQDAFSQATGIARRTLTRLESGDPAVRIGTLAKAARAVGLTLGVRDVGQHRPTLDDLEALYSEESGIAVPANDRRSKRDTRR